jgi:hypothetical protein
MLNVLNRRACCALRPLLITAATTAAVAQAAPPPAPSVALAERHAELARELAAVHAQAAAQAAQAAQVALSIEFDDPVLDFAGRELGREGVVKGAPYCAVAVHETVQVLADGNRIVKRQRTPMCRDGEGRTRREVQVEGGPRRIYLSDPVARTQWVLDPDKKTARTLIQVHTLARDPAALARQQQALGERMRANGERWGEWARELALRAQMDWQRAPLPPSPPTAPQSPLAPSGAEGQPEPGVIVEREVVVREGRGEPQRQREVRVLRLSELPPDAARAPMPPLPPMPPLALHGLMPRGEGVTTPLAAKEIEGLKVHGERTTWTLEAGKIGNEKPIVSVREVWRSPELMLTVSSRDSDPRSGEVVYRLEQIQRGEPDPALMRVPADYARQTPRQPQPPKGAPAAPAAPGAASAPAKPKG